MSRHRRRQRSIATWIWLYPTLSCSPTDPFHTQFEAEEPAIVYRAKTQSPVPDRVTTLTVMTWNIKFGAARVIMFFECDGKRTVLSQDEILPNLEGIARKIRQVDPDIVLLQEIDRKSKRSAYIDQVQWLLDATALNHAIYASIWKADFIPSDGIARVDAGNAILSRWPITDGTRISLEQDPELDALTSYFYLQRNLLRGRIDVGHEEPVVVINVHAEAFASDETRQGHVNRFLAEMEQWVPEAITIAGGDLNALPPGTLKTSDFADNNCTDQRFDPDNYEGEDDWLTGLYVYHSALPLADYQAHQEDHGAYFTYSGVESIFWNRTLDHLFSDTAWEDGLVHQDVAHGGMETMSLSDHAPISARLVLP